jgi:hypothetical protein
VDILRRPEGEYRVRRPGLPLTYPSIYHLANILLLESTIACGEIHEFEARMFDSGEFHQVGGEGEDPVVTNICL